MKPATDTNELELDFQRRADFDFIKRALPGVYLYLFAWPVIFLSTGFSQKHPDESILFGALFTVVCLLRLVHGKATAKHYEQHYHVWNISLTTLCLTHAGTWGALFYLVNFVPHYAELSILVNLVTAGIASASVQSLITKFKLTCWYISFLLLPLCTGTLLTGEQFQLCFIVFMFWLYLLLVGRRYRREYERAFRIEKTLSEKQIELHRLNRTDPLTQAHNRRYFNEQIDFYWQHCAEQRTHLNLVMLDIDHFKRINDEFGHPTGDQCLKHFVSVISNLTAGNSAELFRYGGEEFAVLLPNADPEKATFFAELARDTLEKSPLILKQDSINMTLSAGVCSVIPEAFKSQELLVELADQALYSAKSAGRNCVQAKQYVTDKLN
ncbi:GGDEF domain-containing protein [Planctobacterium marinum]|uniref:diguanylate cyclase n=1 Tax=Planctobacterium marinum TaxID=1631968 RepID=A0AA48HNV3_9ALTE|nr:hypothetical protein MACH26_37520 [Planctobacterium marinum]